MAIQSFKIRSDEQSSLLEESKLWNKFKKGNQQAFSQIYQRYVVLLYHYGERLTSDHTLIEDAIHDLFMDLWRNKNTLGQAKSVKFYLLKGLKRIIVKKLAKDRKYPFQHHLPIEYNFQIILSHENEIIHEEIQVEENEKLLQAINQALTPRQKEAITLKFYDNLSYDEVASLLSLSTKSTYKLIYRALEELKSHLAPVLHLLAFLWFL